VGTLAQPEGTRRAIERLRLLAADLQARSQRDDVGTLAAALTYAAFLSIFPLLLLGLSITGFVLQGRGTDAIEHAVAAIPGLQDLLTQQAMALVESRVQTGLIGLVGTLWAASALSNRARRALARIFGQEQSAIRARLEAVGVTLVLGAAALVTIGLSGYVVGVVGRGPFGTIGELMAHLVVAAMAFGLFLLSYRLLIPARIAWRDLVPGAVVAAVGWTVLQYAGSWFVERSISKWSVLYGTIATVFGVLLFLRLSAWIFLAGAELSAALRERRARQTD